MKTDGINKTLWEDKSSQVSGVTTFTPGTKYDVVVVGAGITGITTAMLLQKGGKKVLLVDAQRPAFGTTGGTTAHLNNFFDASYDQVISDFGLENAKLFAEVGRESMAFIRQQVTELNIECTYLERPGYLMAMDNKQQEQLSKIVEATKQVGVEIEMVDEVPLPIPAVQTALIPGQAQFHPLQYLEGLLESFTNAGGQFAGNCRVNSDEDGDVIKVTTTLGDVEAGFLVYATHLPPGINILHLRNAPYRSYAMAFKLKSQQYPQLLAYDLYEPYHYYRSQVIDGQEYLIAGGEDHKTGHATDTDDCFETLANYVGRFFDIDTAAYKWSSQYYVPVDGLPYIGHFPGKGKNVFTATGFNGNGMILGTISGKIIAELILQGSNKYEDLFSPSRMKPVAGFTEFVKEQADVVMDLIGDRLKAKKVTDFDSLAAGEAKVVKYEGQMLAAYRDDSGKVHAVNAICPHLKCAVAWNSTEKSWDCPCHGSRFSIDGEILTGPSKHQLEKIPIDD